MALHRLSFRLRRTVSLLSLLSLRYKTPIITWTYVYHMQSKVIIIVLLRNKKRFVTFRFLRFSATDLSSICDAEEGGSSADRYSIICTFEPWFCGCLRDLSIRQPNRPPEKQKIFNRSFLLKGDFSSFPNWLSLEICLAWAKMSFNMLQLQLN